MATGLPPQRAAVHLQGAAVPLHIGARTPPHAESSVAPTCRRSPCGCTAAADLPPGRRVRLLSGLVLLGAAAGCASVVRVQPLATPRVEVAAYNLRGPSLDALRREAARLCVNGGEVLRQSQSGNRRTTPDGMMARMASTAMAWVDPPQGEAQMMVVCRAQAADRTIAPVPAAAPAPAVTATPASAAAHLADPDAEADDEPDAAVPQPVPARAGRSNG